MIAQFSSIFLLACALSHASVKSGKATADWITSSDTCEAGMQVKTGIRLVIDAGYHTYWINPGESGMKISVDWELPSGWKAGNLEFPVPKRFTTAGFPGFGYEGTVIFPVILTAPPNFSGEAMMKAKVSWLTCGKEGCIPGKAELELTLKAGPTAPTTESKLIDEALKKIPVTQGNDITLKVIETPKTLQLVIEGQPENSLKLSNYEVFPATPEVIDAAEKIHFTANGSKWNAEVKKSEYATKAISELVLVFAKPGETPISLSWKIP